MAFTYRKIQSVTVSASTSATIEFTSIPQTYTDLEIVFSLRSNRAEIVDNINLRFNGTTTNHSARRMQGNGSTTSSSTFASNIYIETTASSATVSTFGNGAIYIPNYMGSQNKSVSSISVTENNATQARQNFDFGLWSNTAAITSIALNVLDGTGWLTNSTAVLYGILQT